MIRQAKTEGMANRQHLRWGRNSNIWGKEYSNWIVVGV